MKRYIRSSSVFDNNGSFNRSYVVDLMKSAAIEIAESVCEKIPDIDFDIKVVDDDLEFERSAEILVAAVAVPKNLDLHRDFYFQWVSNSSGRVSNYLFYAIVRFEYFYPFLERKVSKYGHVIFDTDVSCNIFEDHDHFSDRIGLETNQDYMNLDSNIKSTLKITVQNEINMSARYASRALQFLDNLLNPPKKRSTKSKWGKLLTKLEEDAEYKDPIYEQTDEGMELQYLCGDVDRKKNIQCIPSIQLGRGSMEFYDEEDNFISEMDYQDYNNEVLSIAFDSNSANEFKRKYAEFLDDVLS